MSHFQIADPRFARYVLGNAPVEKLTTGFRWVEGPVWFADAGCLLFSDPHYGIMTDSEGYRAAQELPCQVYRLDPVSGAFG